MFANSTIFGRLIEIGLSKHTKIVTYDIIFAVLLLHAFDTDIVNGKRIGSSPFSSVPGFDFLLFLCLWPGFLANQGQGFTSCCSVILGLFFFARGQN